MSSDPYGGQTPIKRQAVVIIHGIGEQRPLGTLKSFVRSFRPKDTFYSKPERMTASFEARRMKLRRLDEKEEGENWIETDFFEYYWAHLMFGARWRHFVGWASRVLARGWRAADTDTDTGRSLHNTRVLNARKWIVASLAAFTVIAVLLLAAVGPLAVVGAAIAVAVLVVLLDWMSASVLLRVVGDVSRYLDVRRGTSPGGTQFCRAASSCSSRCTRSVRISRKGSRGAPRMSTTASSSSATAWAASSDTS